MPSLWKPVGASAAAATVGAMTQNFELAKLDRNAFGQPVMYSRLKDLCQVKIGDGAGFTFGLGAFYPE